MNDLFKSIFKLNERKLHTFVKKILNKKYGKNKIISADGMYLYAEGDIPILLVAHMDTVHRESVKNLFIDEVQGVAWSPEGLGADDRAGIYSIIEIINSGFKPHILFTHGEEKGGIGARIFTKDFTDNECKFMIELDRKGSNDAVFYDCGNKDFQEYILSFGFELRYGSFSDISTLSPAYDIASVNLSIGYYHEHTFSEFLRINEMFATIEKVKNILLSDDDRYFDYQEDYGTYYGENKLYSYVTTHAGQDWDEDEYEKWWEKPYFPVDTPTTTITKDFNNEVTEKMKRVHLSTISDK